MSIGSDIRFDRAGLPQVLDQHPERQEQAPAAATQAAVAEAAPRAAPAVDRGEQVLALDPWAGQGAPHRLPFEAGFQNGLSQLALTEALEAGAGAIVAALES